MRSPVRSKPMLATLPSIALWVALLAGCSTDPVNPDACRAIENARCESAASCSTEFPDFDVEACKRFYDDQCLHGLASESDPGQPRIDQCVRTIQAAGECAKGGNPTCDFEVSDKTVPPCGLIQKPEQYAECDFLAPPAPPPDAGPDSEDAQADGSDDAND